MGSGFGVWVWGLGFGGLGVEFRALGMGSSKRCGITDFCFFSRVLGRYVAGRHQISKFKFSFLFLFVSGCRVLCWGMLQGAWVEFQR